MLLLLDNYDSFTYNLYQYLAELGAEVEVRRNDQVTIQDIETMRPAYIVVSPGPCTPNEAGQSIGQVYGGRVIRAPEPMHGKSSRMHHNGTGVFKGLPEPFEAIRYHSLIVENSSLPDEIEITARTEDGLIMGLRHRTYPVQGVQFHPESIMTTIGKDLLRNFLEQ
jgi:anthranilate/para-aminobenzoate synthase component II